MGEWLYLLSYLFFAIWATRLSPHILYYGDAFHVAVILQWMGYASGGTRWGLPSIMRWLRPILGRCSALWIVWFFWSAIWGSIALVRHYAFYTDDFDVGLFGQVLQNLSRFNGFGQTVDVVHDYFRIHQNFILPVLAPLFWLPRSTELMLLTQAFLLFLPGVLLALAVRRNWKSDGDLWAWLVLACWFLAAPVIRNTFWDFHETCLSAGFLALWAWGLLEGNAVAFVAGGRLAGLTKENLLVGVIPGVLLFPLKHRSRFRPWFALAALHLILFWLEQHFLSELNYSNKRYGNLGTNWSEVLIGIVKDPAQWTGVLMNEKKRHFLLDTIQHAGYFSLLGDWSTLAWIPLYFTHTVTNYWPQYDTFYHYVMEVWPAAMVAAMAFWKRILTRYPTRSLQWLSLVATLVFWPETENPWVRFNLWWPEARINGPIAADVRREITGLKRQCRGPVFGVVSHGYFAQVYDLAESFPLRTTGDEKEWLENKKGFKDVFGGRDCTFLWVRRDEGAALLPKLVGNYEPVKTWLVNGHDETVLYFRRRQ